MFVFEEDSADDKGIVRCSVDNDELCLALKTGSEQLRPRSSPTCRVGRRGDPGGHGVHGPGPTPWRPPSR